VFIRAVRDKFQRHRALSATAVFYLAVRLFAQSDLVWSLRPYIWVFFSYALVVFAAGGLAISLFLACWTWLDPEKEKHRIWKGRLARGGSKVPSCPMARRTSERAGRQNN
jgi:hypothetical protein